MTFRDGLLGVANAVRGVPQSLGLRPTTVTLRTRVWAGGEKGEGAFSDTDTILTPTPRIRELSMQEVNASAGEYERGDIKIGPITPPNANGGYSRETLEPTADENGIESFFVLEGENAGEYAPKASFAAKGNVSFFVIVRRRNTREA